MGARSIRTFALLLVVIAGAFSAFSLPAAFGHSGSHVSRGVYCPACANTTPTLGNARIGAKLFVTQACGACHILAEAKSAGTLGPNLDTLQAAYADIVTQITNGGKALMGAAANKYKTVMKGYKGVISTAQIQDIAKYVYDYAGKVVSTTGTTTTTSGGAGGGGGGVKGDGCPPGQTIQSLGADDHDDDDTGGPTDGDGCV